jgi:hypothetical protein
LTALKKCASHCSVFAVSGNSFPVQEMFIGVGVFHGLFQVVENWVEFNVSRRLCVQFLEILFKN